MNSTIQNLLLLDIALGFLEYDKKNKLLMIFRLVLSVIAVVFAVINLKDVNKRIN